MARLAALAALAVLSSTLVGCQDRTSSTPAAGTPSASTPAAVAAAGDNEPAIELAPGELDRAILDNPISADQKWLNKRLRFASIVVEVGRDKVGYFVTCVGGETLYPAADQLDVFGGLKPNDEAVFEGTLTSHERNTGTSGAAVLYVYTEAKMVRIVRRGR